MNIKEFKEGDIVTRNAPVTYEHNSSKDSSWCGDRMGFFGVDVDSKIIFLRHLEGTFAYDEIPFTISYARDGWDEGWTYYPESMWQKFKQLLIKSLE